MSNIANIKMVVDAINNVKTRAKQAAKDGDFVAYKDLMDALLALENCLLVEVEKELKVA